MHFAPIAFILVDSHYLSALPLCIKNIKIPGTNLFIIFTSKYTQKHGITLESIFAHYCVPLFTIHHDFAKLSLCI